VKKLILSSLTVAILATLSFSVQNAQAQGTATKKATVHKVGLIDMAHVFKEYTKFKALREGLKAEITQSDTEAKAKAADVQKIQEKLKQLKQGSPDFLTTEKQLAQAASNFEAFRKVAQRDFLRKEAGIYHTVYMEVADAVQKYADVYYYTLIIRFNREDLDSADPQKLIQGMNRQVVFHRPEDDITLSVLDFLNRKYDAEAKKPGTTQTR